jgi:hypothetical protein
MCSARRDVEQPPETGIHRSAMRRRTARRRPRFRPVSSHQVVSSSMRAGPAIDGEGNATLLYGVAGIDGPRGFVSGEFGDWTVTRDAGALSVPEAAAAGAPVAIRATVADL